MYNEELIRFHACLLSERKRLVAYSSLRMQICLQAMYLSHFDILDSKVLLSFPPQSSFCLKMRAHPQKKKDHSYSPSLNHSILIRSKELIDIFLHNTENK